MLRPFQQLLRVLIPVLLVVAVGCSDDGGSTGPSAGTLVTAAGTGSLILTEDVLGFAPLPGVSATIAVADGRTADVLIETDGGIQVNSLSADAVCVTDVAVFVDDVQVGPGRRILVSNTSNVLYNVGTFGFSLATDLTPGSHAITVRAKAVTPLAAVQCYVGSAATGSDLPGRPHLQTVLNVISLP